MTGGGRELSAPVRLAGFGLGLAAVLAGSLVLGRATGSAVAEATPAAAEQEHQGDQHAGEQHGAASAATGTSLSDGDLRLDVPNATLPALQPTAYRFRVLGEDGPITEYDVEQGKQLHLVLVSRDLARYAHLHPELAPDGTWSTLLTLAPGSYRAVADFSVAGTRHSLAVDVAVPGPVTMLPLAPPATAVVVDDLEVELDRDGSTLAFTATRDGAPVVPEPYLGARGHLVAFRVGDLAYAHVHPSAEEGAATSYEAELPGPGTYRLFLELQVDGRVRQASFTLEVS